MNTRLLRAFKASGRSGYWLAKQTGLSESMIGKWRKQECGISIANAEKIARALGKKLILQ